MNVLPMTTFKCILVGNGGVGKTTFIKKHLMGEFVQRYVPTLGVDVSPIVITTDAKPFRFNVWDVAGQEQYGGLGSGYYVQADCAIVMFDLTSRLSYHNCQHWVNQIRSTCGNIPTILVGTKSDITERKVLAEDIDPHHQLGSFYYDVSAKSGYQIEKPFTQLVQILTGNISV